MSCDRSIAARMEKEVYKTIARSVMRYGLEAVALTKRLGKKVEAAKTFSVNDQERRSLFYTM